MNRFVQIGSQLLSDGNKRSEKNNVLRIQDPKTSKSFDIPITNYTIRAADLKQIQVTSEDSKEPQPLVVYDPAGTNTASCTSAISYIDGLKGILRYRGYPIEELADKLSFEEVTFLLMWGELPDPKSLKAFRKKLLLCSAQVPPKIDALINSFPRNAHPMGILTSAIAALSTYHPEMNPAIAGQAVYQNPVKRMAEGIRVIGMTMAIAAKIKRHADGQSTVLPALDDTKGFTENFMNYIGMTSGGFDESPNPILVKALDKLFILHAEHEMNCSTAAVRHIASSNPDLYTAVSAGVAALYGPRHGGANEATITMLQRIQSPSEVPNFIEKVKNKQATLMGFGHRIYKNHDPRSICIRKVADAVFAVTNREPLLDVALKLENEALRDAYFISRKLFPNVDFFSGLVYKAMGFHPQYFTVLFAVARCAGWVSHWSEFQTDSENKIVRPRQIYNGITLRHLL